MLKSGLVSISFRTLSVAEVISLATSARLSAIEWGGDIHVPHGNLACARETVARVRDAGLSVAAYGSYYKAAGQDSPSFDKVLETAVALGAPTVRIWAGSKGSADCSAQERGAVIADLLRVTGLAEKAGMGVACENHGHTLTDSTESLKLLLAEAGHPNLRFYWQPLFGPDRTRNLENLQVLVGRLANVHAFYWAPEPKPLEEGRSDWTHYLDAIRQTQQDHFVMLEFVPDHTPASCLREAATLKGLLGETSE